MLLEMVHLHNKIQFSGKFAPKKIPKFLPFLPKFLKIWNFLGIQFQNWKFIMKRDPSEQLLFQSKKGLLCENFDFHLVKFVHWGAKMHQNGIT